MFYTLKEKMLPIKDGQPEKDSLCIGLLHKAELLDLMPTLKFSSRTLHDLEEHHQHTVNKLDSYFGYCFGIVDEVQWKEENLQLHPIGIYFKENLLLLVSEDDELLKRLHELIRHIPNTSYSLAHVLTIVLEGILYPLHAVLEDMETVISQMEEEVLDNHIQHTVSEMSEMRRLITVLAHYFAQMMDIAEELEQDENRLFDADNVHHIRIFSDRVQRYEQNVQMLKEYTIQVRELQQAQNDLNLNRMMYVFTIVTIIFLPLTLIVGWYGMNFTNMPELRWQYGYFFVILLSIGTIVGCIWYFKRKNILKK